MAPRNTTQPFIPISLGSLVCLAFLLSDLKVSIPELVNIPNLLNGKPPIDIQLYFPCCKMLSYTTNNITLYQMLAHVPQEPCRASSANPPASASSPGAAPRGSASLPARSSAPGKRDGSQNQSERKKEPGADGFGIGNKIE